jgi:hypothetical protein
MSYRAWHYRRTPNGQFVCVATADMQRLFDGQICMEPTVPGAVHIATVYVQVADRRAMGLKDVRFDRYPVNERGECTPEIMTEMRRMWAVVASDWYSRGTARAVGRHMKEYVMEYAYWAPTTADKRALAVAVNHRAGWALYQPDGRPLFLIR